MIICHSRKFIFFSNPKTGSESLRSLLEPWSEEPIVSWNRRIPERPFYAHMSPVEAEWTFEAKGWDFSSYTRITTVRNPFDRLVSLYRMIREVDGIWQLRRTMGLGTPSFASWVTGTKTSGRGGGGRTHQRWRRFGTWSAEHWCAGRIDHMLRLEHLEEDFEPVAIALGISPGDLPHKNARGTVDLSDWYDAGLTDVVSGRYRWDMNRFGYVPPRLTQAA